MKVLELMEIVGVEKVMREAFKNCGGSDSDADAFIDLVTPEFVEMYSELYTEEELDQLVKFYKSSIGKKCIELAPEIMKRSFKIGQEAAVKHMYASASSVSCLN